MSDDDDLIALYGVCERCGAPRNVRATQRDLEVTQELVCTAHPDEHSTDHHYGTDTTDEFSTLAEATTDDAGNIHIDVVQLDKREDTSSDSGDDDGTH